MFSPQERDIMRGARLPLAPPEKAGPKNEQILAIRFNFR